MLTPTLKYADPNRSFFCKVSKNNFLISVSELTVIFRQFMIMYYRKKKERDTRT